MSGWIVPGYTELRELRTVTQGRVVLAVQDDTNALVDITYLATTLRADADFVGHLPEEMRRLAGVDSPYLVSPHASIEGPDQHALVREAVYGITLRELLRQGALSPQAALTVFRDILLGLAAAHRAGVVHRACQPENVLVTEDGAVRLVDCGVAPRGATDRFTAATAGYRAPEQWGGAPASAASDVYAATALFFECVTGRRPYLGESVTELAVQHITTPLPADHAPEPVRALVLHGLAKDPEQRPESALACADELALLASTAYGAQWAESGRHGLVTRVAQSPDGILPTIVAPSNDLATVIPSPSGATRADAPGWQHRPGWLVSTALVVVAGTLTVASVATGDGARRAVAETTEPPSIGPIKSATHPTDPRTSPGAPSGTPEDSDRKPALSTTTGGSARTESPDQRPTSDGGARSGALPPSVTPSDPGTGWSRSPLSVSALTVRGLKNTSLTDAEAAIEVVTTGTGPVTVTVSWHRSDDQGTLGGQHGGTQTYALRGQTRYLLTPRHTFEGLDCYWGIKVSTTPTAPGGSSWQQMRAPLCHLP